MTAAEIIEQIRQLPEAEQQYLLRLLHQEFGPSSVRLQTGYAVEEGASAEPANTTPLAVATRLADESFTRHAELFRRLAR